MQTSQCCSCKDNKDTQLITKEIVQNKTICLTIQHSMLIQAIMHQKVSTFDLLVLKLCNIYYMSYSVPPYWCLVVTVWYHILKVLSHSFGLHLLHESERTFTCQRSMIVILDVESHYSTFPKMYYSTCHVNTES